MSALSNASMKIGQAIYSKKSEEAPKDAEEGAGAKDAEYEEKKDEKK